MGIELMYTVDMGIQLLLWRYAEIQLNCLILMLYIRGTEQQLFIIYGPI